jgi:hypothetical protein
LYTDRKSLWRAGRECAFLSGGGPRSGFGEGPSGYTVPAASVGEILKS